jgi:hypothetical protein
MQIISISTPDHKLAKSHKYFLLTIMLGVSMMLLNISPAIAASKDITIYSNGTARFNVVVPKYATLSHQFAGQELTRYLKKLSGSGFNLSSNSSVKKLSIVLQLVTALRS